MGELNREHFLYELSKCFTSTKKTDSNSLELNQLQIEILQKLKEKSRTIHYYGESALSTTMTAYYDAIEADSKEELNKVWNEYEAFVKKENEYYFKHMTVHSHQKESETSS